MKILVVRLSSLGDILHLFPAISDLRRHYPNGTIHWLVEPGFAEVVSWHEAVDRVITIPLRAHKKVWWKIPILLGKLRRQLQAAHYDFVLDAQGLLKSAVLSRLAGVPVYGFDGKSSREPFAARLYDRTARVPDGLHVIEKNRLLIKELFAADIAKPADFGIRKYREERRNRKLSEKLTEITGPPYIVILHGTTWNSKYWPEDAWLELIRKLTRNGLRCLVPWGNEVELERAVRLQTAGGEQAKVLPRLSLTELMDILLDAQAFVSVESGIGHLAAAFDVPGVMLHGPTDPEYSGILGKACKHITSGIYCSPCFKRNCPRLDGSNNIPPCQQLIMPEQVEQKCMEIITASSEGQAA